ncbi:MAG TPA: amidohydrolase family protein, partial [Candidatus Acidoferrum sp.]|nr:amidohydrolase family protein [Candidatus Acidoferrum sp.]
WLTLLIAAVFILASARVRAGQQSASSFVIRNVRVFDGEKVISRASVIVANGKIVAVGVNLPPPSGVQLIDATGDTLLPGLIDSHVHIWTRDVLASALAFGVTTELDMFMRWRQAKGWKEEESKGAYDLADFRTAGTCVTSPAGHGTQYGFPIPTISSPQEADAFVDARIAEGSDYIKIMYDFGANFTVMSRETMAAVVKAAHKRGKLVLVHIGSYEGAIEAIEAGADGLAHLPFDRLPAKNFGEFVKLHHAFVETTLAIPRFLFGSDGGGETVVDDPLLAPYLLTSDTGRLKGITPVKVQVRAMILDHLEHLKNPTPFEIRERESLKGVAPDQYDAFSNAEQTLRMLDRAGVPILVATDAASGAGAGSLMHAELETVVKAGLSPVEALTDATSVPAKIFSLNDRGRIAPGLRADLLLVHGDPTVDIRATRDIVAIWKQGVRFDRDSFRESIAQRNEAWHFGRGWFPWSDVRFGGNSSVHVSVSDAGPDRAALAMTIRGNVDSRRAEPFAGAMYFPIGWGFAPVNYSGVKDLTFWAKGGGDSYGISMFTQSRTMDPGSVHFAAGKDWEKHTIPLSAFGTDGHDITGIFIGGDRLGQYQLEISQFRFGTGASIGVDLIPTTLIPGSKGEYATQKLIVGNVAKGSPADTAGLKPRDVITSVRDERVNDPERVKALLWQVAAGSTIPIEIMRDGKPQTLEVKLGER